MKEKHRKIEKYVDGLEQRMDCLQDHHTKLVNENNALNDKNKKMEKYMMGLERDIEAICGYLEKDKNETDRHM